MFDQLMRSRRLSLDSLGWSSEKALNTLLMIVLILLVAVIVRWIAHRLIDRITDALAKGTRGLVKSADALTKQVVLSPLEIARREQRGQTIASVLKSSSSAVIGTVALLMDLDVLKIPIGPLLASAGIAGVAVGFGAQSLVKDVISGLFMLAEDQYGVGDVVDVGEAVGTVESVGLRITRLRDAEGTVWYVRNGEILRVGNLSAGFTRGTVDISIAYDEDQTRAQQLIESVGAELRSDATWGSRLLADPEMVGVQNFSSDGVTLRVALTTELSDKLAVATEFRRRVLLQFEKLGIKAAPLPLPPRR